jgi:anti-sigma factor RsiW
VNCESFQDRIERFVAGALDPAEMAEARDHVALCSDCAAVARIFGDEVVELRGSEADGLTGAVLDQTSGSTCRTAQEKLCSLQDGELDEADAWLVRGHLDHCGGCAALARSLAAIEAPLAAMASLPLDDRFTDEVMAATVQATREEPVTGWLARLRKAWTGLHQRPRFALEFAYAATVVLVLLTATPVSPFKGAPGQALTWLRANAGPVEETGEPGAEGGWLLSGWDLADAVPQPARDFGNQVKGDLAQDLGTRRDQLGLVWGRFDEHRKQLAAAARDRDLGRIGLALDQIGCDLKLFWRGLRKRISGPEALVC